MASINRLIENAVSEQDKADLKEIRTVLEHVIAVTGGSENWMGETETFLKEIEEILDERRNPNEEILDER